MLMGTQRRKLNWTDPPGENGLTMVFSTRPLRIGDPCACEKRGEESTLVFLVVFGRGSEGWQHGWVYSAILANGGKLKAVKAGKNLKSKPPESPALPLQQIRGRHKNCFFSRWRDYKRGGCPHYHTCHHLGKVGGQRKKCHLRYIVLKVGLNGLGEGWYRASYGADMYTVHAKEGWQRAGIYCGLWYLNDSVKEKSWSEEKNGFYFWEE